MYLHPFWEGYTWRKESAFPWNLIAPDKRGYQKKKILISQPKKYVVVLITGPFNEYPHHDLVEK